MRKLRLFLIKLFQPRILLLGERITQVITIKKKIVYEEQSGDDIFLRNLSRSVWEKGQIVSSKELLLQLIALRQSCSPFGLFHFLPIPVIIVYPAILPVTQQRILFRSCWEAGLIVIDSFPRDESDAAMIVAQNEKNHFSLFLSIQSDVIILSVRKGAQRLWVDTLDSLGFFRFAQDLSLVLLNQMSLSVSMDSCHDLAYSYAQAQNIKQYSHVLFGKDIQTGEGKTIRLTQNQCGPIAETYCHFVARACVQKCFDAMGTVFDPAKTSIYVSGEGANFPGLTQALATVFGTQAKVLYRQTRSSAISAVDYVLEHG